MVLAKVVGTVVASQKEPTLEGTKFLVLERLDEKLKGKNDFVIAIDAVGAGEGEVVLFASGSSARQTSVSKDRPCDAVIMAIVDSFTIHGTTVFKKSEG